MSFFMQDHTCFERTLQNNFTNIFRLNIHEKLISYLNYALYFEVEKTVLYVWLLAHAIILNKIKKKERTNLGEKYTFL